MSYAYLSFSLQTHSETRHLSLKMLKTYNLKNIIDTQEK